MEDEMESIYEEVRAIMEKNQKGWDLFSKQHPDLDELEIAALVAIPLEGEKLGSPEYYKRCREQSSFLGNGDYRIAEIVDKKNNVFIEKEKTSWELFAEQHPDLDDQQIATLVMKLLPGEKIDRAYFARCRAQSWMLGSCDYGDTSDPLFNFEWEDRPELH